jgi:hypothetical protein
MEKAMSGELRGLLKSLDHKRFDVADHAVTCWFGRKGESRRHVVRLQEVEAGIRMEATVVTARTLEAFEKHEQDPHLWAWRRNRVSNLVGFRVDGQKRMLAEVVLPTIGLTADEFLIYLMAIASEADRMELVLTARDVQ